MSDRYIVCPVCRSSILNERIATHRLVHEQEADELRAEAEFDPDLHAHSISETRGPNLDAARFGTEGLPPALIEGLQHLTKATA